MLLHLSRQVDTSVICGVALCESCASCHAMSLRDKFGKGRIIFRASLKISLFSARKVKVVVTQVLQNATKCNIPYQKPNGLLTL